MSQHNEILEQSQSQNFGTSSSLIQDPQRATILVQNPEQIINSEGIQGQKNDQVKYTMESLCRSFINRYAHTSLRIEPSMVTAQFGAKLRRVYDLTNILQGGGIIEKVEKGVSRWKCDFWNFNFQKQPTRNDWCSLRSISSQIRYFFDTLDGGGFTCHDIYNLLTSGKKPNFNPSTIRRRIYQCCKVFTIVGLIQKIGKLFYNAKIEKNQIQQLIKQKIVQQSDKNLIQLKYQNLNKIKLQRQYFKNQDIMNYQNRQQQSPKNRKQMIKKLVNTMKNSFQLQTFIKQLTLEYQNRKSYIEQEIQSKQFNPSQFSQQVKYQQQVKMENQNQPVAQIHKTIIISSSKPYSFLVSKNSNFCSFSQNQVLKMYPPLQKARNVKGI